jgi:Domain of unknown function (DUF4337)
MTEDLKDLHEQAERGATQSSLAPVTVTMAIIAVLVAATSLAGHRAHTKEILLQTEATDQWAYYQAKEIRRRSYELFLDQLSVFSLQNTDNVDKLRDKYTKEVEKYQNQQSDIEGQARNAEDDVRREGLRADRFDLGDVLLEAALVICSITLLTRKRGFWRWGLVLGVLGAAIGVAGLFAR